LEIKTIDLTTKFKDPDDKVMRLLGVKDLHLIARRVRVQLSKRNYQPYDKDVSEL
jgi:hypothetical protein